jgi:hypothetical protein
MEEDKRPPKPEPCSFRHVALQDAGTIRVRYTRIEPLLPRTLEDANDISD